MCVRIENNYAKFQVNEANSFEDLNMSQWKCIRIRMHIYIYTNMYVRMYNHVYVFTYTHMYVCTHACMYTYTL